LLSLHTQFDTLPDLFIGVVGVLGTDHRLGVTLGLEQPRDQDEVELLDLDRLRLQPFVGGELWRDRGVPRHPPASFPGLAGDLDQDGDLGFVRTGKVRTGAISARRDGSEASLLEREVCWRYVES
jgi:hypothetical protein